MGAVIEAAHRFGGPVPQITLVPELPDEPGDDLDKLIDAFVKSRRMQATRDAYRRDILGYPDSTRVPAPAMSFVQFLDARDVSFFRATRADVDDWRNYMETAGLSPATRARRLAAVKGLYTYGTTDWSPRLPHNPAGHVEIPRSGDYVQYLGLSVEQIQEYLQAPLVPAYRLRDRNWVRTAAIVAVLVGTGIRRNELVSADAASLGWESGKRVLYVVRKGGHEQRMELAPNVCEALDVYLDGREKGPLILSEAGQRIDGSGVYRSVRSLGEHCFPDLRPVHPHDLRHTCATLLYSMGCTDLQVQTIMGHADVRTTRRYNHSRTALEDSPLYPLGDFLTGAR